MTQATVIAAVLGALILVNAMTLGLAVGLVLYTRWHERAYARRLQEIERVMASIEETQAAHLARLKRSA